MKDVNPVQFLIDNVWVILYVVWGLPLGIYRSRFRKIAYQTDSWTINIKPYFLLELKALFGNLFPENKHYHKTRNFYRMYLLIYLILALTSVFIDA
jgi:peroxiredoxin Q/BCP